MTAILMPQLFQRERQNWRKSKNAWRLNKLYLEAVTSLFLSSSSFRFDILFKFRALFPPVYLTNYHVYLNTTSSLFLFFLLFRFDKLSGPATDRRQQLQDSLKFQQFSREVEETMQWIKEHRPLAESTDYGKSLVGVQNLQKKHQALLNENTSYEGNVEEIGSSAKELLFSGHFASDSIETLNADLQQSWTQLKILSAGRTQKLADALEAQKVCLFNW